MEGALFCITEEMSDSSFLVHTYQDYWLKASRFAVPRPSGPGSSADQRENVVEDRQGAQPDLFSLRPIPLSLCDRLHPPSGPFQ